MSIAPDIHHLPTREGYDRWAAIYDDEQNPLVTLEQPHIDALLGDVRGLHIADIGCGTGRHAIQLLVRGAHVTAIDFSEQMLERARAKVARVDNRAAGSVAFIQHDLAHPLPLPDHSADRVLCSLVLDHIPNLACVFAEFKRICKRDGSIVISTMHPALMLKGVQARFTDPVTGRETRPKSCPHQISDYVMSASQADLSINHMREHAVDASLAARCPRAEKYVGWPLLLMMRLARERSGIDAAALNRRTRPNCE